MIKEYIIAGDTKKALETALSVYKNHHIHDNLSLLNAQFADNERQNNLDLIDNGHYQRTRNRINNALLGYITDYPLNQQQSASAPTMTTPITTNPLVEFDDLYRDGIHRDLTGNAFNEAKITAYVQKLATIFNMPQVFMVLLDPLQLSGYKYGTTPEKNAVLQQILETLVAKHDNWRTRLETKVKADNSKLTFQETVVNFLKNPTVTNWEFCKAVVNERLSESLYGGQVQLAWQRWANKIDQWDDFDLAFEMKRGTQNHSDFMTWLGQNLDLKNFNYA